MINTGYLGPQGGERVGRGEKGEKTEESCLSSWLCCYDKKENAQVLSTQISEKPMTLEMQCVLISLHLNIYFVSMTASDPSSWRHDVTGRSQDQTPGRRGGHQTGFLALPRISHQLPCIYPIIAPTGSRPAFGSNILTSLLSAVGTLLYLLFN